MERNNRRMGIERFDYWINRAIKDWHDFINEQMQGAYYELATD